MLKRLLVSGSTAGRLVQVIPVALLVGLIYGVLRYGYMKRKGRALSWKRELVLWLLVCDLAGLAGLTLVPSNLWGSIWWNIFYDGGPIEGTLFSGGFNFVPTVLKWLRGEWMPGSWTVKMLIGNMLMLVPTGVLLPLAFPRLRGWALLLLAVAIPAVIELLQPVVGRSFDVDDVISNFVGMEIGCLFAVGIRGLAARKAGQTATPGPQ